MVYFIDCNTISRPRGSGRCSTLEDCYKITEEEYLDQLLKSYKSGLVADGDKGIYLKEGFGALVDFCPDNCSTLEELLNFTASDFYREKPTGIPITKKVWEARYGKDRTYLDGLQDGLYFNYKSLVEENGYDLVIGPSCSVYGQFWNKGVYCKNYQAILDYESAKENEYRIDKFNNDDTNLKK